MNFLIGLLVGASGVAIAALWRYHTTDKPRLRAVERRHAVDQAWLLTVLRRELANEIQRRDRLALREVYKQLRQDVRTYTRDMTDAQQADALKQLTPVIAEYSDFDLIHASSPSETYATAFAEFATEDLIARFVFLARYYVLMSLRDPAWTTLQGNLQLELSAAYEAARRDDLEFIARLQRAFANAADAYPGPEADEFFETDEIAIWRIEAPYAPVEFRVHLKATDEYAVWGYLRQPSPILRTNREFTTRVKSDLPYEKAHGYRWPPRKRA